MTVVTKNRETLFGDIMDGEMVVNDVGKIVCDVWNDLSNHYAVTLDEFVVMPNHVHGIVFIEGELLGHVGVGLRPTPTESQTPISLGESQQIKKNQHTLSEIIRAFKSFSSRRINEQRNTFGVPVWQRGFHDRIIRNETELNAIRDYIQTNPQGWLTDSERPS